MAEKTRDPGIRFVNAAPPKKEVQVDTTTAETAAPQTKQIKKVPPVPDKPIPTTFWRGGLYKLNCMFGRPDRVPSLSRKQALALASEQERSTAVSRQKQLEQRLWNVFNTHRQKVHDEELLWERLGICIGVFGHAGSAGKTLTSVMYGNIISHLTKASVVIAAATKNPGSTTAKSGVSRDDTLSLFGVEKLMLEHGEKLTSKMVKDAIATNQYGTYVLAQESLPPDFTGMRLRRVIELLKTMFDVVVLDTGNNLAEDDGIEQEAFNQCDLPIFVCAPYTKPESPVLMGETMDSYKRHGDNKKLRHSVVLINGTQPSDSPEKWAMYAESRVDDYGRPIGTRAFPFRVIKHNHGDRPSGKMFYIPHDDNLRHNPAPRIEEIAEPTYRHYLEAISEITHRAGVLHGRNFGILDEILDTKRMLGSYDWRQTAIEDTSDEEFISEFDSDAFTPAGDTPASTEGNFS